MEQHELPPDEHAVKRVTEHARKQATRSAARKLILRIGLVKLGAVLLVTGALIVFMMSIFGASYLAASACLPEAEAALGAPGGGTTVGASVFGGAADPKTGHIGYRGDDLTKKWDSYAELSTNPTAGLANLDFAALGKALGTGKPLPRNSALRVTGPKGSLVMYKRDVGAGGSEVQGYPRAIDLWHEAAAKLGAAGLVLVKVEPVTGDTATARPAVAFTGGAQNSSKMVRPTTGPITSNFGPRWGRLHAGMDIAPPMGTPIVAALAGRVVFAAVMSGYGNFICIRHTQRLTTCYAHQQRFARGIRSGVQVDQGQLIGYVGNTGNSTGPHLHFEVRLGPDFSGTPTDPAPYVTGAQPVSGAVAEPEAEDGQCVPAADVSVAATGNYAWPIGNSKVGKDVIGRPGQGTHSFSSPPNNWQSDNAIDIATKRGDPIVAVSDGQISPTLGFGKLTEDGGSRFAGLRLYLVDSAKNQWYYAHLSRSAVKPGQDVKRGDVIGYSGAANGVEHLHLGVKDGSPLRLLGTE